MRFIVEKYISIKKKSHDYTQEKGDLTVKGKKECLLEDLVFIKKKISVSMKAIAIRSMLDGPRETVLVLLDVTGKCSHYNKTLLQEGGDGGGREGENIVLAQ